MRCAAACFGIRITPAVATAVASTNIPAAHTSATTAITATTVIATITTTCIYTFLRALVSTIVPLATARTVCGGDSRCLTSSRLVHRSQHAQRGKPPRRATFPDDVRVVPASTTRGRDLRPRPQTVSAAKDVNEVL